MWCSLLGKEWRLLATPSFFVLLIISWFTLGWFLISSMLEYQAIAPKLATLQNRRGATEMLLGNASQLLQWLMILWTIFFGARSLAQERQWHTDRLFVGLAHINRQILLSKILTLWLSTVLLTVPFWLFTFWLALKMDWDNPLLFSQLLAQWLISNYACALALTVSASQKQALPASLLLAIIWLLLWLAPVLTSSPIWLVDLLRWLSPFEHTTLLYQGIASIQTLTFYILHLLLFATLMPIFWTKELS